MVGEFAKAATDGSAEVHDVVLLGPVLDEEHYRTLLMRTITTFDQLVILNVDLLQGLAQMVQCASPSYLVSDDVVNILVILRICLQELTNSPQCTPTISHTPSLESSMS